VPRTKGEAFSTLQAARYVDRKFDMAAIALLSFLFLVTFIVLFDNTQAVTSNGVFKALTIKQWLNDPAGATLDRANYLYYPLMAVLCRALDLVGVWPGDPRHQLAIINAFFAAVCLCIVYSLALHLTGNRAVAWATAVFHLAGAFFFNLAISNEDILPAYTLLLGSMALACVWFINPTWKQVAIVSVAFTLAWLVEWRLLFPTLPGLLLALALGPGSLPRRAGRIGFFLAVMIGFTKVAILLWGPQNGNVGPVADLLWTGKGVDSGWAGFAVAKWTLLWVGIAEYLVGGGNLGDLAYLHQLLPEMRWSTLLIGILAVTTLLVVWRRREELQIRMVVAIFGTTFVAGEIMNLYSQPQDPQMQINVMPWLTAGMALTLAWLTRWRPLIPAAIVVTMSLALLFYNVARIWPMRGADSLWSNALVRLEQHADPTRTVLLVHGFEQMVSEMFYAWDGDWTYFAKLGPAPSAKPKAKLLTLANSLVHTPDGTGEKLADDLKTQIHRAMDLGYDVIINNIWLLSPEQFISSLSTVAGSAKAVSLHRMLHESFDASPVYDDPAAGPYFLLRRHSKDRGTR
jgi:hypothetical protein